MSSTLTGSQESPLATRELTRCFGNTLALEKVTLSIPRGKVFGLVGENGAGKTTLIKLALGLLKPTSGEIRVFGIDPVAQPESALARIGYLSEDHDVPPWMTVDELMRYTAAFYPKWDQGFADELCDSFQLPRRTRIRSLSRGQRAQAGLISAMAHRPDLLLLDEPSSGLDAVVRRDILGAIIRTVAEEGRTVVFSSHLLDEVERVSDHVAMIHKGEMVLCGPVDDVKGAHHRITLRFEEARTELPPLPGVLTAEGMGREWTVVCDGEREALRAAALKVGGQIVDERMPSLEDVFVARVRAGRPSAGRK